MNPIRKSKPKILLPSAYAWTSAKVCSNLHPLENKTKPILCPESRDSPGNNSSGQPPQNRGGRLEASAA